MTEAFFFITDKIDVSFEETAAKGARIEATFAELETVSQQGTMYRFEDAELMRKTLEGQSVYYGTNIFGKHDRTKEPVGFVESVKIIGNKLKGIVKITAQHIIEDLKRGIQFLFSVGGQAERFEEIVKFGRCVRKYINAICTHLQIVDVGTKVGFPTAKMEKLIEIQETVLTCSCDENACSCPVWQRLLPEVYDKVTDWFVGKKRSEGLNI